MALEMLIAELEGLVGAWGTDDPPDPEALSDTLERAMALAPGLSPGEGAQLCRAVDAAVEVASAHLERVGGKLRELKGGRRAVRGYGSLRAHRDGQRIRVKA